MKRLLRRNALGRGEVIGLVFIYVIILGFPIALFNGAFSVFFGVFIL